jgi:hypothetical protein
MTLPIIWAEDPEQYTEIQRAISDAIIELRLQDDPDPEFLIGLADHVINGLERLSHGLQLLATLNTSASTIFETHELKIERIRSDLEKTQFALDVAKQLQKLAEVAADTSRKQSAVLDAIAELKRRLHSLWEDVIRNGMKLVSRRKEASKLTVDLHIDFNREWRNGLCQCCHITRILDAEGNRLDCAEMDHYWASDINDCPSFWLVCSKCNAELRKSAFRFAANQAFMGYYTSFAKFVEGRQPSLFAR